MKPKPIRIRGMGCGIIAEAVIHKRLSVCGVQGFALHTSHACFSHVGACYRVSHIGTGCSVQGICRVDAKAAIRAAISFARTKGGKKEVLRVIRAARKMIKEAQRAK